MELVEYEVRFEHMDGNKGGLTVRATNVHEAIKVATKKWPHRIAKITAVVPWEMINNLPLEYSLNF